MMDDFQALLASIRPVDMELTSAIQAHLDDLTKPKGSLGRLEEIAMKYALARGTSRPSLKRKKVFCFAGDHGVAAAGVSAYPAEVTPQMVYNMLAGGAAINVLSSHAGAELTVVDMGVAHEFEPHPSLRIEKVRKGTSNIAVGPAMSVDEVLQAIMAGARLALEAHAEGYDLLATGEMGIANTTPATALYASMLGLPAELITGRGTGIDDEAMQRKVAVIKTSLEVNAARLSSPLEQLAALGGFEIAGICGLVLGGASVGLPVVVDGFISSAGAVAAMKLSCKVSEYLFFSHLSNEQGHKAIMNRLGARPILDLDLRLGEGTGAALAMLVIEGAVRTYNEMATFSSANVSRK
ncbi:MULTISPECIES: nicotinate-nucleotide--dimethylbenzimidazole phosphoribosyltransferase [Prosthecochloris]|uniref:Nicotinate-nucleotide--dimethylbenzimidazole phosphoribosyltransferase n=1 Tax=Prosthecochloris vibrioformis TaxID=1098 RepID=A0A5C4S0V4_PROVB|nr:MULTISPECIES: nicotinate-nucleotide--dimethylbenzimidazole phosphoribosyltransferase [Prosthecochloris]ANT65028.1 Nicotinate-nucleotide--dimethylbenzimidazole phosphoribosyltransferase [Prosthecochloris sp. CIB 2401]TNJ36905.1 nicotinate-nucleotide--dimethylbenzimidazole phosphoribosyltransferase [Prosthecochloris vibrioformis]